MNYANVHNAIAAAEALLPGQPAAEGEIDARWQAIIEVGAFIDHEPRAVWDFVARWGRHKQADLRMAIATCLLEHLLEHHFDLIFPRVEALAQDDGNFADTFQMCSAFGQSEQPRNHKRWARLREELGRHSPESGPT